MKKISLSIIAFVAMLPFCGDIYAQDTMRVAPIDGEMVRLQASSLWKLTQLPELPMTHVENVAQGLRFPSISPDGSQIIMYDRINDSKTRLVRYQSADRSLSVLLENDEASPYVQWESNHRIAVRQPDKPFFQDGVKMKFDLETSKRPLLREKKHYTEENFIAYDADDVIILVRKDTQTLQAISDTNADRYYAPMVSPDEKFVVFSGLTTGIHVFDIAKNAVVYIGKNGTSPSFSPDGRYLIYAMTDDDGHVLTTGDLMLLDLETHSYRKIANPSKEIRTRASLSQSASSIAYETEDGKIFRATLLR